MATFLVTTATSAELKCIKPLFESALKELKRESPKSFGDFSLRFLTTGVGSIATTYALTQFLAERAADGRTGRGSGSVEGGGVDFLLNIGVCGMRPGLETVPEVVQAGSILHTGSKKERIPPPFAIFAPFTAITCSDTIAKDAEALMGRSYVDMESYGIAYVADHAKIPYAILKCPFDTVWSDTDGKNKDDLERALRTALGERIREWIETARNTIGKIPREQSLEALRTEYRLTCTEFEQLKKIARKIHATTGMELETHVAFLRKGMEQERDTFERNPEKAKKWLLSL